jgi:hypothetical protein
MTYGEFNDNEKQHRNKNRNTPHSKNGQSSFHLISLACREKEAFVFIDIRHLSCVVGSLVVANSVKLKDGLVSRPGQLDEK